MLDLKKLDHVTGDIAAYCALFMVYEDSHNYTSGEEEERVRTQRANLAIGYAMGRLSRQLSEDGCDMGHISELIQSVRDGK